MTAALDNLATPAERPLARRFRLADPSMILWLAMIAILVFLILSPMVRLVVSSFQEPETGRLTLSNYAEAYGRARHLQALWNTLLFGAGVAVLAVIFGVPLAWAISRTDMPAKGFIRLMVFGAFIIPPYLGAIGWILLAGPNAGWLNKVWMATDRRGERPVQRLFDDRADRGRGGHVVSLRVRVHRRRARSRLVRDGGRREHPRRRHACAPRSASRCRWCCPRSSAG